MTREELFNAVGCLTYSSYHNYDNIIYGYDLQFYNKKKKKYIYNYSIIYRNENTFPMYGVVTNMFYVDSKICIINNMDELKKFGLACMNEDNSIFTKKFDIQKINVTDDKTLNQMARNDKSILNMVYKEDYTYILRIKE